MPLSIDIRGQLIESCLSGVADDTLSINEAVRRLRVEVTGFNQTQFARM